MSFRNMSKECTVISQTYIRIVFSVPLENVEQLTESLVEKYKGPRYCNTCYHGNADVCLVNSKVVHKFI